MQPSELQRDQGRPTIIFGLRILPFDLRAGPECIEERTSASGVLEGRIRGVHPRQAKGATCDCIRVICFTTYITIDDGHASQEI